MSLSIVLDQPPGTKYTNGDTISGRVTLALKKEAQGGTIWVEMLGISKAEVSVERRSGEHRHTEYYNSVGVPLYLQEQLFDDPNSIPTTGQTFPFAFQLPWNVTRWPANLKHDDEDSFKEDPPTFISNHDHSDRATRLPPSYGGDSNTSVRYFVSAEFRPQEGRVSLFHKGLSSECDFEFYPTDRDGYWSNTSFASDTKLCDDHIRSFGVLDSSFHKGHAFGDHLKKMFHSDSVPKFNFAVKTTYPTEVPPNYVGRLPILIQVLRMPTIQDGDCKYGEGDINVTQAKVTRLEVRLDCYSKWRARNYTDESSEHWDMLDFKSNSGFLVDVDQTNIQSGIDSAQPVKFEFQWPTDDKETLTSAFAGYNLSMWYTLTVKARIEIGGEEWKGKLLDDENIEVISSIPWNK